MTQTQLSINPEPQTYNVTSGFRVIGDGGDDRQGVGGGSLDAQ